MRLLRLTTRKDTADFESSYQADIVLKPKSKIALQSVAINSLPQTLILSSENNSITYQISGTTNDPSPLYQKKVNLTIRTYTATQINQLLEDIEDRLNDSVDYIFGTTPTEKPLGLEWRAVLEEKKVNIGYEIGRMNSYFNTTAWTKTNCEAVQSGAGDNHNVGMTAGLPSVTTFANMCSFPFSLSRGNGFIRCRTRRLETGNTKNGYMLGLVENIDDFDNMDLTKVKFGLRVTFDGANRVYKSVIDGIESTVTVPMVTYAQDSATNDYGEVMINGEFVDINIYQHDGNSYQLSTIDTSIYNNQDLYPFIAFFGTRTTTQVNGTRLTPSPYGNAPDPSSTSFSDDVSAPPKPINPSVGSQGNFIFFESDVLSQFLGYNTQRTPIAGELERYTVNYKAPLSYFIPEFADACLVQLMNLQIDSYDSFSDTQEQSGGQRKNILSIIPSTSQTARIIYEPSYPTFLDLNNENPIYLRNLHIRVLREDYSPIAIDGLGTIVILIE